VSENLPAVPERHLKTVGDAQPAVQENLPAQQELSADDPQWVICGMETPGGVLVFASQTLSRADLRRRMTGWQPGWGGAKIPTWSNTLTCEMTYFVQVRGETYASAMKTLFEMWSPDRGR
jgi:hypothetical protein